jgi:hypothetical protein
MGFIWIHLCRVVAAISPLASIGTSPPLDDVVEFNPKGEGAGKIRQREFG